MQWVALKTLNGLSFVEYFYSFSMFQPASQAKGTLVKAEPLNACTDLANPGAVKGHIVVMLRGDCMFIEKVRGAAPVGDMHSLS